MIVLKSRAQQEVLPLPKLHFLAQNILEYRSLLQKSSTKETCVLQRDLLF